MGHTGRWCEEQGSRGWLFQIFYFFRKKVELVPIYVNIAPCVVIDFQTEALMEWNFIRRKLLLPVGVDAAQIEQPGEEGVVEE